MYKFCSGTDPSGAPVIVPIESVLYIRYHDLVRASVVLTHRSEILIDNLVFHGGVEEALDDVRAVLKGDNRVCGNAKRPQETLS